MTIKPSKKYLTFKAITTLFYILPWSLIPLLLFTFLVLVLNPNHDNSNMILILILYIISCVLLYVFFFIKAYFYVNKSYVEAEENALEVFRSFVSQNKENVPYIKISSIDVNQGVVERLFGLGTIGVTTEYDEGMPVLYKLPGFDFSEASNFTDKIVSEYKLRVSTK